MRTTLDIDDDVLEAAKEIGRAENKTAGQVLSSLARKGLNERAHIDVSKLERRNGFLILPRTGRVITNEMIDKIKEEIELEEVEAANALRRQRPSGADRS